MKLSIRKFLENDDDSAPIRLWLDDLRDPKDPFNIRHKGAKGNEKWVKTAQEAIKILSTGKVESISLDHDLGEPQNGTGNDVAKWIEEAAYYNKIPRLSWSLHSDNTVGVRNMYAALKSADKFWEKHEEQH